MLMNGGKLDGRYLLEKEIGSGGFGAVYLATDTRFSGNNRVAIKQILLNNEQATKLFRQEADLLYNLSHPNLPKVTNCFEENGANFIVMDYISGEDLATSLKTGKHFSVEECVEIADKVLDALEYLHSFLIYHRDIKPHNIKIDESGKIFLLDFGTAKGNLEKTNPTMQFGQSITGFTPFYAPLEQVLRVDPNSFLMLQSLDSIHLEEFLHRKTDERSDIYSLGATLYHLLTAHSPERATATIRAFSVWSGKPDPLPPCSAMNPEISPELAAIIHRSLEIEPEKRFQKASEMRQALRNPQAATSSPKISELMTIALPPESNPSIQPTAVFLDQSFSKPPEFSFSKPSEALSQAFTTNGEPFLQPTLEAASPTDQPVLITTQTAASSAHNFVNAPPVNQPKPSSKLPLYLGAAFVFLILSVAGGWFALRSLTATAPKKADLVKTETIAPPAAPPVKKLQSLSYFLTVQKMRDGKPYQQPFQSSGQEIFENGYNFQMFFSLPESGYFYVFAEGLDDNGATVLKIQFPTPRNNNGSAAVLANRIYETGKSNFDGKPGTEKLWICWSREKNAAVEDAVADAFKNGSVVTDSETRTKINDYFETAAKNKVKVEKDADKNITAVEFEGDAAAHLIQLEHR